MSRPALATKFVGVNVMLLVLPRCREARYTLGEGQFQVDMVPYLKFYVSNPHI